MLGIVDVYIDFWLIYSGVCGRKRGGNALEAPDWKRFREVDGGEKVPKVFDLNRLDAVDGGENVPEVPDLKRFDAAGGGGNVPKAPDLKRFDAAGR